LNASVMRLDKVRIALVVAEWSWFLAVRHVDDEIGAETMSDLRIPHTRLSQKRDTRKIRGERGRERRA
jgi:hypothetical protein